MKKLFSFLAVRLRVLFTGVSYDSELALPEEVWSKANDFASLMARQFAGNSSKA